MKAAIFKGKGAIETGERPDPTIKAPTDAVVRNTLTCVCGSDLWYYRGQSEYTPGTPIGHEFLGVVEQVGDKLSLALEGKSLHHKVRKNFFKNKNHESLLRSEEIYKKFDDVREIRRKAIHQYEELNREESLDTIRDVMCFIDHLKKTFWRLVISY